MANVIEILLKANDQTGSTFSKLNSSFKSLTGFSLTAGGAIAMAGVAIGKAVEYTKQAIEANDKYVSSIVDMARFTGDEVDAMSRLVQVADDAFLSQEALNNAMSIGAKKGLDMSVEGIKRLADEYNNLGTQAEKNKLLNDNFGRSGLAMGKLLEQGSVGITKNMEAIASNLVVTDKSVKITYDYKKSVDALNDSLDGVKYTVAQNVMPVITDLNIVMSYAIDKVEGLEVKNKGLTEAFMALTGPIYLAVKYYQMFFDLLGLTADKISKETGLLDANTQATLNNAVAKNILSGTSRGSIYNPEYSGTPGTTRGSIYGSPKASGGNVYAGVTYPVGERGIEMFTPSTNGVITPNNKIGGNNDALLAAIQALPRTLTRAMRQLEKYG